MDTLEIKIEPKHFALSPSGYHGNTSCPLWQALTEKFPDQKIWVGARTVSMGEHYYPIPTDKWGGPWTISSPMNIHEINELSAKAKISLEGIPTVLLTLTKIE